MEQVQEMLMELAATLGTTVEYLWGVLIMQARISALNSAFVVLVAVITAVLLWRAHCRLKQEVSPSEYNSLSGYDQNESMIAIMIFSFAAWIIFLGIGSFFAIKNILTALLNPEYWALKEILEVF